MAFREVNPTFEDKSYTMSYYPGEKGRWTSFHTYIPDFYIAIRDEFYSIKDRKLYHHNSGKSGVFYRGVPELSEFTLVVQSPFRENDLPISAQLVSCTYNAEIKYNTLILEDKTLTTISFQNHYQGTGVIELVPYDKTKKLAENLDNSNVKRIARNWNINKIRNDTGNVSYTERISTIVESNKEGKAFYERLELADIFVLVKVTFDNEAGRKMHLNSMFLDFTKVT